MTKNNKGFMLAEVVITSTVIMTAMIALYTTFNKVYNAYNIRSTYYNIDGVYATKKIISTLLDSTNDTNINIFLNNNDNFKELSGTDSYKSVFDVYSIKKSYIIKYNKDSIDELKKESINQTFKDYLNYLEKHYKFDDSATFIVVIEYGDDNNLQYSNIKVK